MKENDEQAPWKEPAALTALQDFLSGWRFPVLVLAGLMTFAGLLVVMILVPEGTGGPGGFADEFRQWCFGWDPATGRMEWGYVVMALLSPLSLMTIMALAWHEPLLAAWRSVPRRRLGLTATAGALAVLAGAAGLLALGASPRGALPFPAEDLRTSLPAPSFRLVDQDGRDCSLEDLRGRVVLITGVYARCSNTCPMLLAETRGALAALTETERADIVVVAITLDPARDTPAILGQLGAAHGLAAPGARFLTGEPAEVERVLDALGIARTRDARTGLVDHANLFLLVDRSGRIAYRLSLGERRAAWLVAGLRALLGEERGDGTT